ncbi:aminoglycoside phosphotransferase family protein [Kribbella antibiotica]|uniref:Aminoglycoside phosphotransferase family protein n=1 Tax=Kribbella antibiotica TaxID=190195 RepID=A0A4R4ZGR1_9ACTN|nr:aminoglycoside phosphotransferase family protein [Kribbella antibiotica]TDD57585.1 aminoglycoside phosphotransferase family protein [Kribbella antibiotica]
MAGTDFEQLSSQQLELLNRWLPGAAFERDHSWGQVGTTVLQLRGADDTSYIVKAGDVHDRHLVRELAAHRQWVEVLASTGHAPRFIQGDDEAKLLVTEYLPGELVEGTDHEWSRDTYRQAGELLARFHGRHAVLDDGEFERQEKASALAWLGRPHRISAEAVAVLTAEVEQWPTPPSVVVPTHGDWQPRNWLRHGDRVGAIDFGRAALRPPHTDFGRLAAQQFRARPELAAAFLEGYGPDPRQPDAWLRLRIRDAISTAAWAYKIGDEAYEQQGHRMIADLLAELRQSP